MEPDSINRISSLEKNTLPVSDIISGILIRYGLEETNEELDEKFFGNGGETNEWIIYGLASRFKKGDITEQDVEIFLSEKFKISRERAEQIKQDLKKTLLPILDKQTPTNKKKDDITNIGRAPEKINRIEKTSPPPKPQKKSPDQIEKQDFPKNDGQFIKKSDTYREPIE